MKAIRKRICQMPMDIIRMAHGNKKMFTPGGQELRQ